MVAFAKNQGSRRGFSSGPGWIVTLVCTFYCSNTRS